MASDRKLGEMSFQRVPLPIPKEEGLAAAIRSLEVGGDALVVAGRSKAQISSYVSTVRGKAKDGRTYRVAALSDGRIGVWRLT